MGRKRTPGLYKRGDFWHIDKQVRGIRLCESTGTSDLREAETYLARRIEEIRQATVYGIRPKRTFRQAATKYLNEAVKTTIADDAMHLQVLDSFIGHLVLNQVHMGTLQPFIAARRSQQVKTRTINHALQVVRHILFLAAGEWLDEHGLTWLETAPRIKFLPEHDRRDPYPLSWEEQAQLFQELPPHLARMALFKVNTGCREHEVCSLRWEWEAPVPELGTSVFLIPAMRVKNREERLVVLNQVARSVIGELRGVHPEYVFTYKGRPVQKMNSSAWRKARIRAGLAQVRVHDLKHTFGRRLRAAGVSFEDRQDLLGHKSGRVTTHYSAAELGNLIDAANRACGENSRKSPALVVLKRKAANA
jgi:integrase